MLKNKNTLILTAILAVCIIICIILAVFVIKNVIVPTFAPSTQYMELPIAENMPLAEAKARLEELQISYEIVPTSSRVANRVERLEYVGKNENGKALFEIGTQIKIYANEIGIDKVIYLTFDDGPTRDNTMDILNTLESFGIKASFFVVGEDVELWEDRMVATFDSGHVIACHSHTHAFDKVYASVDSFISEIEQYENALKNTLGEEKFQMVKPIIRFPGGTNNAYLSDAEALEYINAVRSKGYKVYDWTALTGDAEGNKDAQSFIAYLEGGLNKATGKGEPLIVLMHDKWSTNEALSTIIEHLISKGYYFDTVDNCPEYTFVE